MKTNPFPKFIVICVVIIAAAPIALGLFMTAFGISNRMLVCDTFVLHCTFEDAPEGTVYLDPLIRLKTSDERYTDFTAPPKKQTGTREVTREVNGSEYSVKEPVYEELNITSDSEIAQYCEDGYVSLSLHYRDASEHMIEGGHYNTPYITLDSDSDTGRKYNVSELKQRYGAFKAAYVGENGEVLGVTERSRQSFDEWEPYELSANGGKLAYNECSLSPWKAVGIFVVAAVWMIAAAALPVMIVLSIVYKIRHKS